MTKEPSPEPLLPITWVPPLLPAAYLSLTWVLSAWVAKTLLKMITDTNSPLPWLVRDHCYPFFLIPLNSFIHSAFIGCLPSPGDRNLNEINGRTQKDKTVECVLMVSLNLRWPKQHSWSSSIFTPFQLMVLSISSHLIWVFPGLPCSIPCWVKLILSLLSPSINSQDPISYSQSN